MHSAPTNSPHRRPTSPPSTGPATPPASGVSSLRSRFGATSPPPPGGAGRGSGRGGPPPVPAFSLGQQPAPNQQQQPAPQRPLPAARSTPTHVHPPIVPPRTPPPEIRAPIGTPSPHPPASPLTTSGESNPTRVGRAPPPVPSFARQPSAQEATPSTAAPTTTTGYSPPAYAQRRDSSASASSSSASAAAIQNNQQTQDYVSWEPVQKFAFAICRFTPEGDYQIELSPGEKLKIQERSRDQNWFRGVNLATNARGIFPVCCTQLSGFLTENGPTTTTTKARDPAVQKIDDVILEWNAALKKHYQEGRYDEFDAVKDRIILLLNNRRRIVAPNINEVEKQKLLEKTLAKIEETKRLMGLDVLLFTPSGQPADLSNTGVNELIDMHLELAEKDKKRANAADEEPIVTSRALRKMRRRADTDLAATMPMGRPDRAPIQLLLDYKAFICSVGEEVSLFFSLYSDAEKRMITEEFEVALTAMGMPKEESKIGQQWALFKDLSAKDLSEAWLMCRVIRMGKMLTTKKANKAKQSTKTHRRPFAYAMLQLSDEVLASKGEQTVPLWKWRGNEEDQFYMLPELIPANNVSLMEPVPTSTGVVVSINRFMMPHEQFKREYPEYALSIMVNKIEFPEVIYPGEQRSDFYVTLSSGDFKEGQSPMNVEVIVTARLETGKLVQNALSVGSGAPKSIYKSFIVYHTNTPVWNETIKVSIPTDLFNKTHLHFNVRHCGTSDSAVKKDKGGFAYTFMRLCNPADGTVVANGEHQLSTYKNPKNIEDMVFYLKGIDEKFVRKNERITIHTHLSSALLTQNSSLLALLSWQDHSSDDLTEVLKRITFVDQNEIIKFLKEIFDAMFAILDTKADLAMLVYNALVFIVGFLVDEKTSVYTNFRSVVDAYIEKHFSGKMAHKTLMNCLQFYMDKLDATSHARQIRDSMKAVEYLFKFIVASRILYNKLSVSVSAEDNESFKDNLKQCLLSFNALMSQTTPSLMAAQVIALKNYSPIIHELARIFGVDELASIACSFIASLSYDDTKKQLNIEKLHLIHELVSGSFYRNTASRAEMMPTLLNVLSVHMDKSVEEILECVDILGVLLDCIQTEFDESTAPLATWELVPLLPQLMDSAKTLDKSEHRFKVMTCILSFFHLMEGYMFDQYIDYLDNKQGFLVATFDLLELFLQAGYPANWFVLCMFQYATTLKVLNLLSPHVKPEYEEGVWQTAFRLCISLLNAGGLQLERFPAQKREDIQAKYGDIRAEVATLLSKRLWQAFASFDASQRPKPSPARTLSSSLIGLATASSSSPSSSPSSSAAPSPRTSGSYPPTDVGGSITARLVEPAIGMLAIPVSEVKREGVALYIALLERDAATSGGSFDEVANKTIDLLDKIVGGPAGEALNDLLVPALQQQFEADRSSPLSRNGVAFLNDLRQLLALQNELRTLPEDSAYDDERVIATMKLMAYLKETNRQDNYIKYVHVLCNQHLASKYFTEAALTLLLHANTLQWSDQPVPATPAPSLLPKQRMRERKELLIRLAIDYFDKGKHWEDAIGLTKELVAYYEKSCYDYKELANLLRKGASFYENIITTERFFPEYFRVGYYGKGFPPNLSGKEFIYRGMELERIADFIKRIQTKFPAAELLKSTEAPPPNVMNAPGQFLLITPVTPSSEKEIEQELVDSNSSQNIPYLIRSYHKYNNVNVFVYAKSFNKQQVRSKNEFEDNWIKKSFLVTEASFPSVHRSIQVVKRIERESPPIVNAIKDVEDKTEQLLVFIEKHSAQKGINLNPFTMQLNGVIDANVNGGLAKYQEAFLNPQFAKQNPGMAAYVERFREALHRQLGVVQKGVQLHKTLVPEEMMGLHQHMEESFEKLKLQLTQTSSKVLRLL